MITEKQEGNSIMDEKQLAAELRKKYINNPPEGMTPDDINTMSDSDLLDMDYFLSEDEFNDDDEVEDAFFLF